MREIKFRFFHLTQKYVRDVAFFDDEKVYYKEYDDGDDSAYDYRVFGLLLQYTGIKDRFGKELYEGDIFEVDYDEWYDPSGNNYPHPGRKETISVKMNTFLDFPDNLPYLWNKSKKCWDDERYDIKIIGNIYENPDLEEPK